MTVSSSPFARAVTSADIAVFEARVQGAVDAYYGEKFPSLAVPFVGSMKGRKYIRVFKNDGTQRFVYGFICRETGDLYKAASWKSPARNFTRGNIFDEALQIRQSSIG